MLYGGHAIETMVLKFLCRKVYVQRLGWKIYHVYDVRNGDIDLSKKEQINKEKKGKVIKRKKRLKM